MGNLTFKEGTNIPIVRVNDSDKIPKHVIEIANLMIETLMCDTHISKAKWQAAHLFDVTKDGNPKYPYMVRFMFETVGPYMITQYKDRDKQTTYIASVLQLKSNQYSASSGPLGYYQIDILLPFYIDKLNINLHEIRQLLTEYNKNYN